jgi:hypothetical protein
LEAIPAINGLATVGLERHLRIQATAGTNGVIHSSLRAIITAAVSTPIATVAAAITVLLGGIPTGFAFSGRLKPFGFIKITLFLAKRKAGAASSTSNLSGLHKFGPLYYVSIRLLMMRSVILVQ